MREVVTLELSKQEARALAKMCEDHKQLPHCTIAFVVAALVQEAIEEPKL